MKPALIIVADQQFGTSLSEYLQAGNEFKVHAMPFPTFHACVTATSSMEWVMDQYTMIANWIDEDVMTNGGKQSLSGGLGIIEFVDSDCRALDDIMPLHEAHHTGIALASMLILSYPEIHWVLHTPYTVEKSRAGAAADQISNGETCQSNWTTFAYLHLLGIRPLSELIDLHRAEFAALFDAGGLRDLLKNRMWQASVGKKPPFPRRGCLAASVDEEHDFAYFNALAAYRLGYRCWSLSTWRAMCNVLAKGQGVDLVFEDLCLNFPDKPKRPDISVLSTRDEKCPALKTVRRRVFVTGGDLDAKNRGYLTNLQKSASALQFGMLCKPIPGLYRAFIPDPLFGKDSHGPLLSKDYCWPPDWQGVNLEKSDPGHSAPGRLLMVAERLIGRARMLLKDAGSVPQAVTAAVLALEAKELLAGRTPTVSLEALAIQHEAEAAAESMFIGVQYNLLVEDRLQDVGKEVDSFSAWFRLEGRERSAGNAKLAIVERLAQCFRNKNQIEEELECLAKARVLRADFASPGRPGWLLSPLLRLCAFVSGLLKSSKQENRSLWWFRLPSRYFAFCLGSLGNLVWAAGAWVLIFALLHLGLAACFDMDKYGAGPAALVSALSFITMNPPPISNTLAFGWFILWVFQGGVSVVHVGLLISHFYVVSSRR